MVVRFTLHSQSLFNPEYTEGLLRIHHQLCLYALLFFFNAFSVGGGTHFSNNIKMSTKIMLGAKNLTVCSCTRGVIRIVLVAPAYSITSLESGSGAGYFQGAICKNVSGTQLSDPTLRLCPHSQSTEEDWLQHLTNTPAQIIKPSE